MSGEGGESELVYLTRPNAQIQLCHHHIYVYKDNSHSLHEVHSCSICMFFFHVFFYIT